MTDLELYELYNNENTRLRAYEAAIQQTNSIIGNLIHVYYPSLNYSYLDDVMQECRIAVMRALATYNPRKGTSFSTWSCLYIKNAMREYININLNGDSSYNIKKYGKPETVSIFDIKLADSNSIEDIIENIALYNSIEKALSKLTEKQRYTIMRCYGLGRYNKQKPRDIAADMGIAVSSLAYIRRRAEKRLRIELIKAL